MTYTGLHEIFGNDCRENVPMRDYTSFRTGGPARALILVRSEDAFARGLRFAHDNAIPVYILGNCSNVLVSDKGLDGAVFLITSDFSQYSVKGEMITAQSGILLSKLASVALEHSLTGLEFASGIPGTLGAAVAINAGAYGGTMADIVLETRYIDADNIIRTAKGAEHSFGYRESMFCDCGRYILSAVMKLNKGDREQISGIMKELSARRREKQPLSLPSAGSVFKRPPGDFAGRLIQEAGLKGAREGGAQVSELHAGFIVNTGGATSADIYRLIYRVRAEVYEKSGVMLEPEIKILGDFETGGAG